MTAPQQLRLCMSYVCPCSTCMPGAADIAQDARISPHRHDQLYSTAYFLILYINANGVDSCCSKHLLTVLELLSEVSKQACRSSLSELLITT